MRVNIILRKVDRLIQNLRIPDVLKHILFWPSPTLPHPNLLQHRQIL